MDSWSAQKRDRVRTQNSTQVEEYLDQIERLLEVGPSAARTHEQNIEDRVARLRRYFDAEAAA